MKKSIWVLRGLRRTQSKISDNSGLLDFKQKYFKAKKLYDSCKSIYAVPILQEMIDKSDKLNTAELSEDFIDLIAKSKFLYARVKWRTTTCQQDDYEATQLIEQALKIKPDFEGAKEAEKLLFSINCENNNFQIYKSNIANKQ